MGSFIISWRLTKCNVILCWGKGWSMLFFFFLEDSLKNGGFKNSLFFVFGHLENALDWVPKEAICFAQSRKSILRVFGKWG